MRQIQKDSSNISVDVYIVDSGDGTPETGVVYNTSGIDLWYRRDFAESTDITETTLGALTDSHTDGGFLHINNGVYRLDVPDAAFADGANHVTIGGTVTGMIVIPQTIQLVDFNPEDSVRLGLTALPNAAADAAGGLPISDAGGLDMDQIGTDTAAILVDTAEIGTAGAGLTALPWNSSWDAEVQSEVNDALVALGLDHLVSAAVTGTDVTDNSIMARIVSSSVTADWDDFAQTTDSLQALRDNLATATALATVDTNVDSILEDTGTTLPASIATIDTNVDSILADTGTDGVVLANDAITAAKIAADAIGASELASDAVTEIRDAIVDKQMDDSVPTDGTIATIEQALYMVLQFLTERVVSTTDISVKKVDGSTELFGLVLDDATNPTSITRDA